MVWVPVLVCVGVLGLLLVYTGRRRCNGEPPLDKGLIPWLGHAIAFGKDTAKFLQQMKMMHGDIFTVRVAGKYVTMLLDPNSYDAVLWDSDSLNSSSQNVIQKVFHVDLSNHNPEDMRSWMKQQFQGESLAQFTDSVCRNIQGLLRSPEMVQEAMEWKQEGLYSFCYRLLFKAGYLTLFNSKQNDSSNDVYKEFRIFDGLLAGIARSTLRAGERKLSCSVRERLWDLLGRTADPASWQQAYRQYLEGKGVDKETQRRAMLLQLWVTQCNAGPATFWLLGYLLTHPEALDAVRTEVNALSLGKGSAERLLLDGQQKTPVLDSVLSETLRLSAAAFIKREVKRDMTLSLADGRTYTLRAGDMLCLFPYVSPQMDSCIHSHPETFVYNRFLNPDGTEKTDFFSGTRRVKYYTMPWGAGANTCVGQRFAIASIKHFVVMVLTCLDMKLQDPSAVMPPVDTSRYGFGVLQPNRELLIQYRQKKKPL